MHITLHFLDDYEEIPAAVVACATDAARFVQAGPFEITLDHAKSFFSKKDRFPFVLGSKNPPLELKAFQKSLSSALKEAGLPNKLSGFTPHLTLLYDAEKVPEREIAPIPWRVDEFALVHSFVGQSRHEVLDRWALRGI